MRNYGDSAGTSYEDYHTLRIARITPQLHFEGRIHDSLIMEPIYDKACLLHSYAHHYGFAQDNAEKKREKFVRNTHILLQDVYEYPWNLRYLFQLANEYRCIERYDVAVKLFAEAVAVAKEMKDIKPGKSSAVMLIACLYETYDRRIFPWGKELLHMFPLATAEAAFIAWCQEGIAFQYKLPPEQVLEYYIHYKENLERYRKNPAAGQYLVFYGLATVEQELYIMDAEAMAFCSYLALGREEEALDILSAISMDVVKDRRSNMLAGAFAAGDRVYNAFFGNLTDMQWEEWSEEILGAALAALTQDPAHDRLAERMPDLLAGLSVSAIISWFEHGGTQDDGIQRERLYEYVLKYDTEGCSIQELCFYAWVLKEEYAGNREAENSRELLCQYLFMVAVFAERYYNPDLLMNAECRAVPPDICAAYRMALVLADGRASHENVMLLKQALAIFPAFHEEIRGILSELSADG